MKESLGIAAVLYSPFFKALSFIFVQNYLNQILAPKYKKVETPQPLPHTFFL